MWGPALSQHRRVGEAVTKITHSRATNSKTQIPSRGAGLGMTILFEQQENAAQMSRRCLTFSAAFAKSILLIARLVGRLLGLGRLAVGLLGVVG
jgi:hypothetical protein